MMDNLFSSGINTALSILISLFYFVLVMLMTIIFLERVWTGPSQWAIVPVVLCSLALLGFHPSIFLIIIDAVTGFFSFQGVSVMTGVGILAGMASCSL